MSGLRSATARRPLLLLVAAISIAGLCAGSAVAASSPAAGGDGPLARTSSAGETCPNAAFRTGPAASLPDCRAYEMVSPVDKNGGDITTLCQNVCYRTSLIQSTPDGFVYQWRGLPPSIPVPWSDDAVAVGRDPYLDAALASLGSPG